MMKKSILVLFALVMTCFLAISAAAAPVEYEPDQYNAFEITYTGTAGEKYAVIIVEGLAEETDALSVTEDNVQYFNQQTADLDGNVVFEDVLLKEDGTEGSVYISGSDLDEPVLVGYVNVDHALTIPVVAGDVVYEGNMPAVKIVSTGNYTLTIESGYVVVNTGYTAQKTYKVEDGVVKEQTDLENGVVTVNAPSIRQRDANTSGIRHTATFSLTAKAQFKESGYLATAETAKVGTEYTLDMALVASGKAMKGIAYDKTGTDKFHSADETTVTVKGLLYGIPMTKEGIKTAVACRAYYVLEGLTESDDDDIIIYGEVVKTTLYDVARAVKSAEDRTVYNENKEYIDQIVELLNNEVELPVNPDEM